MNTTKEREISKIKLAAGRERMDKIVSLCKRRGLIYPSSEIYGGLGSCWDYGPLGVALKNNIQDLWWKEMTQLHDNIVGLDAAILMHPKVWEASGHVEGFVDPMVDCKKCKFRFRADEIEGTVCPKCGGELTDPRQFNLMFKTSMGPVEDRSSMVYLRPETAQGIYVNYLNVMQSTRLKIPFGIAQVGKAFRNEITPGNFIFRTREFEQMEMQFFVKPGEDEKWLEYWLEERMNFYLKLGLKKEKLRLSRHDKKELAHYAKTAYDIEYEFPFGWKELEGIHNRTDYDLSRHMKYSGKDLTYFDEETGKRYIPYIIETSAGLNRTLLTLLVDAYDEEEVEGERRVILHLSPVVAPIKVSVLPLVKKDGLPDIAKEIVAKLRSYFIVFYDQQGSIGRRYRRQDEVGTPFGITVDYQTKEDNTVTLRYRDTLVQDRVLIDDLVNILRERVEA